VLNFIYYPVSFILWCWHKVFGAVLGADNGFAWALSVVFLVFTLRAILYKPFVSQVRSMRKMQEFQPEIAKLRTKYANDRQKQAEEMQRLQREHGVNPVAGCLPVLVQVPVFIGLFQVLRNFTYFNGDGSVRTENYFFGQDEVRSFIEADFLGAKLGAIVVPGFGPSSDLAAQGTTLTNMLIVMIPLMIAAGIFTHITARHSVARQTAAQGENPQTAIMNKLMLYVFPIGVVVGAPFLPLAILLYWVSNNLWTLGQQYVVYRRIDSEESAKREQTAAVQKARAPKPGQKPVRPEATPAVDMDKAAKPAKTPGAKPVQRKAPRTPKSPGPAGASAKAPTNGSSPGGAPADGSTNGSVNGSANGSGSSAPAPAEAAGNGAGRRPGGSRPPARRNRRRR
jgi:YidC/Oxa1 family membrane protein insertase